MGRGGQVGGSPTRSIVISVRLPEEIVFELRSEASKRRMNLGPLVKEIMAGHVESGRYSPRFHLIPIPKKVVMRILEHLPDKVAEEAALESGRDFVRMLQAYLGASPTLSDFFAYLKRWVEDSSTTVKYDVGERHLWSASHNMGKKWSLYVANIARGAVKELGVRTSLRAEVTDGAVTLSILGNHIF